MKAGGLLSFSISIKFCMNIKKWVWDLWEFVESPRAEETIIPNKNRALAGR